MAQYTNNDDMYIGLLINKAKLCTSSNVTIQDTNAKGDDNALVIKKIDDDNQFLTLLKRIEALEKRLEDVEYLLMHRNANVHKCKKE